jgi:hypothetical protein
VGTLLWNEIARLSIRITSVIGRNHVDDFLPLIDFVKESPGTNAVAPGWRLPILQSLDIGAVMWVVSQLGVETKGSGVNFGLGEKKGSRRIKGSGVFSKPRKGGEKEAQWKTKGSGVNFGLDLFSSRSLSDFLLNLPATRPCQANVIVLS